MLTTNIFILNFVPNFLKHELKQLCLLSYIFNKWLKGMESGGEKGGRGTNVPYCIYWLKNNDYNNLVKFQIHYAFNWHNRQR